MARFTSRAWLAPLALVLAGACAQYGARPCVPALEELLLAPDEFSDDAGMTTPDRGVSVGSGGNPTSVCSAGYSLPGGTIATLNVYGFADANSAEAGYQRLADAASSINPQYDLPIEPLDVSRAAPEADALIVACHVRAEDTTCKVVARYGNRAYWLSVSHLGASDFTQDDLYGLVEAMNRKLASSP